MFGQKCLGKNVWAKMFGQKCLGKNVWAKMFGQKYLDKNVWAKMFANCTSVVKISKAPSKFYNSLEGLSKGK
jgi:hypothetical protein